MSKADQLTAAQGSVIATSVGRDRRQYIGCQASRESFHIDLKQIIPDPEQPRKEFDEADLLRLAASMSDEGQLTPCRVRWDAEQGKHILMDGERRYRAACKVGMKSLLCVVDRQTTENAWLVASIEANCQRTDLSPIDKARAYRRLMDQHGLTGKECAERLHLDASTVTSTLRLLDLPAGDQQKVDAGELSFRDARKKVRSLKPKRRPAKRGKRAARKATCRIKVGTSVVSVTIAKKRATDADVLGVLEAAIEQLRGEKKRAA